MKTMKSVDDMSLEELVDIVDKDNIRRWGKYAGKDYPLRRS